MPRSIQSLQKGILRYQNALAGIPDRVPMCAQLHESAMKEIGARAKAFYTNAQLLATTPPENVTAAVAAVRQYGDKIPH
ncbi:MAG: hypothetical protein V2I56_04045 [Desulfobacteraceae bacterium]|nr:hypothetical protein [Desulfobacteraceae bacterium]